MLEIHVKSLVQPLRPLTPEKALALSAVGIKARHYSLSTGINFTYKYDFTSILPKVNMLSLRIFKKIKAKEKILGLPYCFFL